MQILLTVLTSFIIFFSISLQASELKSIEVSGEKFRQFLGDHVQVYEDTSTKLKVDSIQKLYKDGIFNTPENSSLQFGYRTSAIWLTAKLENNHNDRVVSNLEIRYAPLDFIDVYLIDANGKVLLEQALGDNRPYNNRSIDSRTHVAALKLQQNSQYQLFIRVKSKSSLSVKAYLSSIDELYEYEHYSQVVTGMFYGLAFGLFFYNLFLFVLIKDVVYLHYIIYVLGYTLFTASLDGLLFQFWPDNPYWENSSLYFFPCFCGIFLSLFCREVLQTKNEAPIADLVLRAFAGIYLFGALIFFFIDVGIMAKLTAPVIGSNAFIILGITVYRFFQGFKFAGYFIIGMGSFCFGILSVAFGAMNLHSNYELTPFIFKAGAAIEMIMFSIALAERISKLQATHKQAHIEHLQKMDKLKDEFLANTSHELRTPLNAIIGIADSMVDTASSRLNQQDKHNLSLISGSGYRLAGLVNNILDFSKIKNQDIKLLKRPINIEHIINTVIDLSKPLIKDKDIRLVKVIVPGIVAVSADEDRVYQILHNLVVNAIKFTQEGSVTIRAELVKEELQICVKDTGIGISEEKFKDIFQAFEQADGSIAREYGGTGLGLAISKNLVELHGGKIWVNSKSNQGTTFCFTLPEILPEFDLRNIKEPTAKRVTEKLTEKLNLINRTVKGQEYSSLPRKSDEFQSSDDPLLPKPIEQALDKRLHKLLVIDDEPVNLEVMKAQLATDKYQLTTARNGQEAIEHIDHDEFDLVLLDIMMPGMSGYEVCEIIRQRFRPDELPVIMVTARTQISDLVEGLRVGANDYITKPFVKDELNARIELHLRLKDTVEALVESERKFRNIFNEALEGIFQIDPKGRIFGNPAMARILGYDDPEKLHESIVDVRKQLFADPKHLEGIQTGLDNNDSLRQVEAQLIRNDGTLIWGAVKLNKIFDRHGNLIRLDGLLEDITNRKEAEEALIEAYKDIEIKVNQRTKELQTANEQLKIAESKALAAAESKGEFLANMSHEIRTPMNGVIAAADLAMELQPDPSIKKFLSIIRASGDTLLSIINDILDFSKIEARKLSIEYAPFDLNLFFGELEQIFSAQIERSGKKVELLITTENDLPPTLIGDRQRIQQVFSNLLSNAVKFTENGSIEFGVSQIGKENNQIILQFYVEDTGTGIEEDYMDDLFTPFTQANNSQQRKLKGTGLGMTISQRLVELMRGRLWVDSTIGEGSTFYFTLPLGYSNDSPKTETETTQGDREVAKSPSLENQIHQRTGPAVNIQNTLATGLVGKRILLAEDDPTNQEIALAMLAKEGIAIDIVENGNLAVKAVYHKDYDLILMDIEMPELNGYEATKRIRSDAQFNKTPIIGMSAHAMPADEQQAIAMGMNGYITKPFKRQLLINTIMAFLQGKDFSSDEPSSELKSIGGKEESSTGNNLPGVNLEKAMEEADLDYDSFKEILNIFHQTNSQKLGTLQKEFDNQDWESLRKISHSIKGSAASIGAYDLESAAKALENACRDIPQSLPSRQQVKKLESQLSYVLDSLDTLKEEKPSISQQPEVLETIDKELLAEVLEQLKNALEDSEPSRVKNYFTQLLGLIGANTTSDLKSHIDKFEYETAGELLAKIAEQFLSSNN